MSKAVLEGIQQLKAENARLLAEVERLQAEATALREALEAVEWVFRTGTGYCPWCEKPFKSGHAADCPRQIALAADAGRATEEP